MELNRREFVILGCALAGGCASENAASRPLTPVSIDAGPLDQYSTDGVYTRFRNRGFFVIRRGTELIALSSYCTHRACKLRAEPDRSFHCDCHGSDFDPAGVVVQGPAMRNLPRLPTTTDASGHLIIQAVAH